MNGIKNLRMNSTGTVHAEMYGHPACPSRAKAAGYTETDEAATCGNCIKLLASVEALRTNPDARCYRRPTAWVLATWQESQTHPSGLSRRQLDGVACVTCHRTDAPMVPAGVAEGGQLFECADHTREYGARGTVNTPNGMKRRIYTSKAMVMTQELAAALAAEMQVHQRRDGSPVDAVVVSRIPGGAWEPEPATEACKPWCVRHDSQVGLCFGADLPVPSSGYGEPISIGISYEAITGVVIAIGDTYLPLEDAERLASVLSRQIDRAHETATQIAGVA